MPRGWVARPQTTQVELTMGCLVRCQMWIGRGPLEWSFLIEHSKNLRQYPPLKLLVVLIMLMAVDQASAPRGIQVEVLAVESVAKGLKVSR